MFSYNHSSHPDEKVQIPEELYCYNYNYNSREG